MPQAGIHGLVGMAMRKWTGARDGMLLGVVLGSFTPDLDNLAVAVATLTGNSTEGIHRTATHSVFFVAAVVIVFYAIGTMKKSDRLINLGLGLGLGILLLLGAAGLVAGSAAPEKRKRKWYSITWRRQPAAIWRCSCIRLARCRWTNTSTARQS